MTQQLNEKIDTLTLQFKIKPLMRKKIFQDFSNNKIINVRRKWIKRTLYPPNVLTKKVCFYGKRIYAPLNYDRFYYKPYPFTGGFDGYTIYYCHFKYRNEYVLVTLQHKVIANKNNEEILNNTLIFLDSIGVDTNCLEIDEKLNRIDFKRDAEACNQIQIDAFFNALSKARDNFYGVDRINYITAIKYKPKGSATEIIVYNKWAEMISRSRKRSHVDLDISIYENVIRTELRLKSKRLYNNSNNKRKLAKNLSSYFNEEVIDEHFKAFIEPIFYAEDFYRIDYALVAIKSNCDLSEPEKEKLCNLVTEINNKGFSEAKRTYKYSDDTFHNHIKLLRSIGVNPLTFDESIDIGIIPNFTQKKYCRNYRGENVLQDI